MKEHNYLNNDEKGKFLLARCSNVGLIMITWLKKPAGDALLFNNACSTICQRLPWVVLLSSFLQQFGL